MKQKLIDIYNSIYRSLDNRPGGFSARKITSIAVNALYITSHIVWYHHAYIKEDFEHFIMISIIDALYVLLLLGIVTFEQVVKLKNGEPVKNKKIEP